MLKVDNIIPLYRVLIPNRVSEPCPKLSHVNRILNALNLDMSIESSNIHALNLVMSIESSNIHALNLAIQ